MLRLQGMPEDWFKHSPFTVQGKRKIVGNAVAVPMGRELARAIRLALVKSLRSRSMGDKAWKAFERWVAKRLGGKRRGADFGNRSGGKNDIEGLSGWSIECKKYARPSWQMIVDAERQAHAAREELGDFPVVIVAKKFKSYSESLVVMRFDEFEKLFKRHNLLFDWDRRSTAEHRPPLVPQGPASTESEALAAKKD
jgi:hypothetical protein